MSRFNLSALAVRERAVTLFLLVAIAGAGAFASQSSVARKIRHSPSS